MIDEVWLVCSLGENPFAFCPALYTYLEDVQRYCDEVDILRE